MRAIVLPLLAASLISGCSSSPHTGRSQLTMPQTVSAAYSEVNLRLRLISFSTEEAACPGANCASVESFERNVARIANRLAGKAFELHPDLRERFDRFEFIIADKAEPGSASAAAGTVAIFRGVRALDLSDAALALVIAREMGHVISRHHDENTATSILVSIATQILLPFTGVMRALPFVPGLSAVTQTAAPAAASASIAATATAASFVGSRVVIATYRPQQLLEADTAAMHLLAATGYNPRRAADDLRVAADKLDKDGWGGDVRLSVANIEGQLQGPALPDETIASAVDDGRGAVSTWATAAFADTIPPLVAYPRRAGHGTAASSAAMIPSLVAYPKARPL